MSMPGSFIIDRTLLGSPITCEVGQVKAQIHDGKSYNEAIRVHTDERHHYDAPMHYIQKCELNNIKRLECTCLDGFVFDLQATAYDKYLSTNGKDYIIPRYICETFKDIGSMCPNITKIENFLKMP